MSLLREMLDLTDRGVPFVQIVLVDARGSTPQEVGACALVGRGGLLHGTVGGGKVEAKAIAHAEELLAEANPRKNSFVTWNLQRDVGMTCGGEVRLYFEVHVAKTWEIAVFGAGHVAQALIPLLTTLDCRVSCVDARADWIEKLVPHPRLRKVHASSPADEVEKFPPGTFFVLMSQGHATDFPVLRRILETREAPYLGVIGSHSKKLVLRGELEAAGIPRPRSEAFLCPIGLPIGTSAPEEIAVSVTAQLLEARGQAR